MRSIIADIHDLNKHKSSILDNKIDILWQQIIQTLPEELKSEAVHRGYNLIEDKTYKGESYIRRMLITTSNCSQNLTDFINRNGPYIIYVKD